MTYEMRNTAQIEAELTNTQVPPDGLALWSLGQAGLIIKNSSGELLAIDPYLSSAIERANPETEFVRNFPPVLPPKALRVCNAVLISHFHDDHMDRATLEPLAAIAPELPIWLPSPDVHQLKVSNVRAAKTGKVITSGNFRILPIAAAHSSYQRDETGNDRFLGYFISCDTVSLWHSGDTLVTDELTEQMKLLKPTINVLPINGGDHARQTRGIMPNMHFREAADLHFTLGSDLLLPCHYDMFSSNRDNPAWFVDDMLTRYPGKKFHLMMPGERFIYLS